MVSCAKKKLINQFQTAVMNKAKFVLSTQIQDGLCNTFICIREMPLTLQNLDHYSFNLYVQNRKRNVVKDVGKVLKTYF